MGFRCITQLSLNKLRLNIIFHSTSTFVLEVRIPVFLMMTFRSSSSLNPNSSDSHSLAGLKRRCCLVADEHARRSAPGRSLDRWGD